MPGRSVEGGPGGVEVLGAADVDVGDLVVGDREGARGHRVEVLHAVLGVDLQQAGAAQGAVDVDGPAHAGDAVLGQGDDGAALGAGVVEQRGQGRVQVGGRLEGARVVGAEALEVVVEVREVAERQIGVAGAHDVAGGVDDPLAGDEVGAGSPEVEEGEGAEFVGEFVVQGGRPGVAVGFLAAVGVVDGAGGDGDVGVGAHGVPPADVGDGVAGVGAAGGVPEFVAGDESVVLAPQQDVAEFAEVPAVADDAVLGGEGAGEEGGLGGAGDGGQHGAERGAGAGLAERLEVGHVVEETGGEADDVQDEEGGGAAWRRVRRGWRRSWQFLQAEVRQQVAGEGEFGGDAVGELGAAAGPQLGRERLPGVGLDLQMAGERGAGRRRAGSGRRSGRGAWR